MGRECGLGKEMSADFLAVPGQRRTAGPLSEQVDVTKMVAIAERAITAVRALAARAEAHQDVVAGPQPRYSRTDLLDDSGALMSQHLGHRDRDMLQLHRHVGVANATGVHPDKNLAVLGIPEFAGRDLERILRRIGDRRRNAQGVCSSGRRHRGWSFSLVRAC